MEKYSPLPVKSMAEPVDDQTDDDMTPVFRLLTPESLGAERRLQQNGGKEEVNLKRGSRPDSDLESGKPIPKILLQKLTSDVLGTPLEEIDKYYESKKTFIVISKCKNLFRFSATDALYLLTPFNSIRRGAISILVHPVFSLFIIATIVINFFFLSLPSNPTTENAEIYFLLIYVLESILKIVARGFILEPFTYLRDPWNWLDFILNISGLIAFGVDLGNMNVLRTLRIIRALNCVTFFPGMRIITESVFESMKKLKSMFLLCLIPMSFMAVLSLQLYMGVLTNKCIFYPPWKLEQFENETEKKIILASHQFKNHANNISNQYIEYGHDEPKLCRPNANLCPENFICLEGFGSNPNYGYTNFDTFGWALLSCFRLMTLDFWEDLYQSILISTSYWHAAFFVINVFVNAYTFLSLIMAMVFTSYAELLKKAIAGGYLSAQNMERCITPNHTQTDSMFEDSVSKRLDIQEEDEESNFKGKCLTRYHKCLDVFCVWDCCRSWIRFQKLCSTIIFHPFVELFIMLCIIANIVMMAMDQHNMSISLDIILHNANYFFVAVYAIEAVMKIVAMSPKYYFQNDWNRFDFFIAASSFIELALEGVQGLSILRTFRLLRVFRLAKFWPEFNLFLSIIDKARGQFISLTLILILVVSIFGVLGMHLFGSYYIKYKEVFYGGEVPRWNFNDFNHSFMIVFRAMCGEWIETKWECLLVSGWYTIPFFLTIIVLGNFVVVNLYLAFVLCNFDLDWSNVPVGEDSRGVAEALNRIKRMIKWISNTILGTSKTKEISRNKVHSSGEEDKGVMEDNLNNLNEEEKNGRKEDGGDSLMIERNIVNEGANADKLGTNRTDIEESPEDCCPECCYTKIGCCAQTSCPGFWRDWEKLRSKMSVFVENKYFEAVIVVVIIISSCALAAEDVNLKYRPTLKNVLTNMDTVFAILFFVELLLKLVAMGFKKYFKNALFCLDFVVVVGLMINLMASIMGYSNISLFKTMRCLRILHLLRVMSYFENMKILLNALIEALPAFLKVLPVCVLIWLIFSILGVQMFAGKYFYCSEDGEKLNVSYVNNRDECLMNNHTWNNAKINFDNVLNAYLALLQVATFKGWIDIMYSAVDSREIDDQPMEEVNLMMHFYFVYFIIIGSFITINMFVVVIRHSLMKQMKKVGKSEEMFMTENQTKYYNAIKQVVNRQLVKAVPRPKFKLQAMVFDLINNKKFDLAIMLLIGFNVVLMGIDHYRIGDSFGHVLGLIHICIVAIFTIECVLKIFALRQYYFKDPWNIFDFIIISLAILGIAMRDMIEHYYIPPLLLRVLKLGWALRSVKGSRNIRTFLFTQLKSMDAINCIFVLLFIVMFIYAIFGMFFFGTVKRSHAISESFNFETFPVSMLLLFQISTTAGWDGVLAGTMEEEDCNLPDHATGDPGNCGNRIIAVIYTVSYVVISYFLIFKLYLAVILVNYSQAREDAEEGLTLYDYDMYFEVWQRFDPEATHFIKHEKLSDFLDALEEPFRVSKPNENRIDPPICKGDLVYCLDILNALTKDFFARKGHIVEEVSDADPNKTGLDEINRTICKQREEYEARVTQHAWHVTEN